MKIPICPKHNRPIKPSRAKRGEKTVCSRCSSEQSRSPKSRARRAKRYDEEDIRCINHPERKAQKSHYVGSGVRRCNWCRKHKSGGSTRPSMKRHRKRSRNKERYRKSLLLRSRLSGRLRGIALFERSTGLKLTFPNTTIVGG